MGHAHVELHAASRPAAAPRARPASAPSAPAARARGRPARRPVGVPSAVPLPRAAAPGRRLRAPRRRPGRTRRASRRRPALRPVVETLLAEHLVERDRLEDRAQAQHAARRGAPAPAMMRRTARARRAGRRARRDRRSARRRGPQRRGASPARPAAGIRSSGPGDPARRGRRRRRTHRPSARSAAREGVRVDPAIRAACSTVTRRAITRRSPRVAQPLEVGRGGVNTSTSARRAPSTSATRSRAGSPRALPDHARVPARLPDEVRAHVLDARHARDRVTIPCVITSSIGQPGVVSVKVTRTARPRPPPRRPARA
jgi:hypothetical protein